MLGMEQLSVEWSQCGESCKEIGERSLLSPFFATEQFSGIKGKASQAWKIL